MTRKPRKERRQEPPQESAGQLVWLVGTVLLVTLPHAPFVHPWIPVMVVLIAASRLWLAFNRKRLPSAWLRVPLTLLAFTGILLTYRQISGVDAGSSLLLVMVAMKLLETRGHRDRAVVVFICYFLLFAAFLREQAPWAPFYLAIAVLTATTALLQTARRDQPIRAGRAMWIAGRIVLQATPLMVLLFLLFPRVPGPFWSLPQRGGQATTGLSDSMSPGDITELALSDEVAFRVRFDADVPRSASLYWRGPVLAQFDGRRWSMRARSYLPGLVDQVEHKGASVTYDITLEPNNQHWLLALETPVHWSAPRATLTSTFALATFSPLDRRLSYTATSIVSGTTPGNMPDRARAADTWLPEYSSPRTRAWARELRDRTATDRDFLVGILDTFRNEPFFYTLTPGLLGAQSVDEFLFSTREGFCGHYASAFAVLARAVGIPARVVTGYQGGELNPLGNYWIVRQSDAHAWVEVWLDGRWERIDPTAAVAPERIEWGMDAAIDRGSVGGAAALRGSAFAEQLLLSWDAVNTAWNRWVLAFGPDSQTDLLNRVGIPEPSTRHLILALTVGMGLCLAWIWWLQQQRQAPRRDALSGLYRLLCRRTARAVRPRRPAEGPSEYALAIAARRPDLAADVQGLFGTYARLRYDGTADSRLVARFGEQVRAFRPAATPAADSPA